MPSETVNLSLSLASVPQLAFLLITGAFCIFSAILYYHWNEYSTDARVTRITLLSYFCSTVPLLIIMGIAVINV